LPWDDGATSITDNLTTLRTRNWEKDYFTSALPWAQRGEPVRIPLGDKAVVKGDVPAYDVVNTSETADMYLGFNNFGVMQQIDTDNMTMRDVYADLSEATSAQITDLRRGYALQRFKEKMARGGSRYTEYLKFIFGQRSSDARLQRPEFLGGGKLPVRIAEVLQTSATQEDSAQGNMAGHGVMAGSISGFNRKFEEHGYLIGIMSILPRTGYVQGTRRHFMHTDRFDFPVPDFAHIGEQPVWLSELAAQGLDTEFFQQKEVFGYQRRFAEHTVIPDSVHGDMKNSLDFWHMGRIFDNKPQLNEEFVEFDPSVIRSFPDTSNESKIIVQSYANIQAIRPIPKWGEPI
ncbi:MAG: major capsid protein, partial [Nanopusillaceae archaeon]